MSQTGEPFATGNFARTPFCHLLLYLYEHRYGGTLAVLAPGQSDPVHVRFRLGVADAMSSPRPARSLELSLMPLCGLAEGDYAFYADQDLLPAGVPRMQGRVDPFPFLARALRTHACTSTVDAILARYPEVELVIQPGVDLSRFALRPDEHAVVESLQLSPCGLEPLLASAPMPPNRVRHLVYLLLITKVVLPRQPGAAAVCPVGHASGPMSNFPAPQRRPQNSVLPQVARPSRGLSAQPPPIPEDARRRSIAARSAGVACPLPGPPRVPALPPAPAQHPRASWPPQGSTEAAPSAPSAPSAPPPHPGPTPTPISDVAPRGSVSRVGGDTAGQAVRMARALAEAGRYREALESLTAPMLANMGDARIHAMRAWIIFLTCAGTGPLPAVLDEAVDLALRLDPTQPRAIYVRGLQWLRYGRTLQAHQCFSRLCAMDPNLLGSEQDLRWAAEAELARITRGELFPPQRG